MPHQQGTTEVPLQDIHKHGSSTDSHSTPGITMPSPIAQAALIRDTYARAGLDIRKASDRPQYFEAHGTGKLYP